MSLKLPWNWQQNWISNRIADQKTWKAEINRPLDFLWYLRVWLGEKWFIRLCFPTWLKIFYRSVLTIKDTINGVQLNRCRRVFTLGFTTHISFDIIYFTSSEFSKTDSELLPNCVLRRFYSDWGGGRHFEGNILQSYFTLASHDGRLDTMSRLTWNLACVNAGAVRNCQVPSALLVRSRFSHGRHVWRRARSVRSMQPLSRVND